MTGVCCDRLILRMPESSWIVKVGSLMTGGMQWQPRTWRYRTCR